MDAHDSSGPGNEFFALGADFGNCDPLWINKAQLGGVTFG